MTNDKKLVQCEFGCGVNVYYQTVEFSDSLEIPIPREADDSIHNCPNLDRDELPDVFTPITDDQDLMDEFCQNADYLWDKEEIEKHYLDLDLYFAGIDGLEFKNYRDDFKKFLVRQLGIIPSFYSDITLYGSGDTLPGCLNDDMEAPPGYGIFPPIGLLGTFYEMDGNLPDAKKCYEIQKEISGGEKSWSNRIEETDEQLRMKKQESLIKKQGEGESKKPQTSQQKQDQISLESVITKTYDFELDDLRTYAFDKITKNDMKTILKKTPWYNHNDKTLIDKVREMQAKEETDTILPLDPTDWDYLDLADKIKILQPHINRNIRNYLHIIRRHRNIISHPKRYKKQDLEQRNKMIILYIQECVDFFEKSKDV